MPAYARLSGKTVVFPDAVKVQVVAGQQGSAQLVLLQRQNDTLLAFVRLGDSDFVTVGDEPHVAAD